MENLKDPGLILAGVDLAALVAISVYFYNENKKLNDQLQNLRSDFKDMKDRMGKMVRIQSDFEKFKGEAANFINVNSTLTNKNNEELYNTKNDLDDMYEKVDDLENNLETITQAIKEKGIEIELDKKEESGKRKKSLKSKERNSEKERSRERSQTRSRDRDRGRIRMRSSREASVDNDRNKISFHNRPSSMTIPESNWMNKNQVQVPMMSVNNYNKPKSDDDEIAAFFNS